MRSAKMLRRGIVKQVSCYGHQILLDSTYLIDGIYMLLGQWDPDFDDLCRSALEPGAVIVDAGCHAGLTIFSALQATGDQARIYGFEPDANQYRRCLANLELNPGLRERVTIIPVALSNTDCTLRFVDDVDDYRGNHYVSDEGTVSAPARSLDSWVAENGLDRLDLFKSDAEGHEPQVLAGARQTITRLRPILFFESMFLNNSPSAAEELLSWFKQLDYVVVNSQYPYAYLQDHRGPFPLDLIACPRERWAPLHERLMGRGQLRRRSRGRFRALVDGWRFPEG